MTGAVFWFYGRRLDDMMTPDELAISDRFYAACLHRLGGMAGEW